MLEQPVRMQIFTFLRFNFGLVSVVGFKHPDAARYWMRKLATEGQIYLRQALGTCLHTRIVIGANPTSAHKTAVEAVKAVEKL